MRLNLSNRQRSILQLIWERPRLGRRDIHRYLHVHPNLIGQDLARLLGHRLLREREAVVNGRGRPLVPVEIDPEGRNLVGVSLAPRRLELCKINLLGQPLKSNISYHPKSESALFEKAARELGKLVDRRTLIVGLSAPGLIDPSSGELLLSSAASADPHRRLRKIVAAAGNRPTIVENDMHAMAARWMLTHQRISRSDVLMVYFEDGRVGAAVLIDGRPNRGCAVGGNELGHMRFPVAAPRCYCGGEGCLERIFSSAFVRREGGGERAWRRARTYLCMGIANATNFIRPTRLVLISSLLSDTEYSRAICEQIRGQLLAGLRDRVSLDVWPQVALEAGTNAAWLAMARIFCPGWDEEANPHPDPLPAYRERG